MNEVSEYMLEQEKVIGKKVAQGTLKVTETVAEVGAFKVIIPIATVSAKSLAKSVRLALALSKGFNDLRIDCVNIIRSSGKGTRNPTSTIPTSTINSRKAKKATKHQHLVGHGTKYKRIHKMARRNGSTLDSVEVSDKKMLSFETIARKYGISYGLQQNKGTNPPTWQVFFMAKDKSIMAAAFKEFSNRQLKNQRETPIEQLQRMASRVAEHVKPEKTMRHVEQQL